MPATVSGFELLGHVTTCDIQLIQVNVAHFVGCSEFMYLVLWAHTLHASCDTVRALLQYASCNGILWEDDRVSQQYNSYYPGTVLVQL